MADIFISWGSPDADFVRPFVERLRPAFPLREYSADMAAGEAIPAWINEAIDQAPLVIIFLSDQTADRPWIITELAWCYLCRKRRLEEGRRPLAILPVRIGPLPQVKVPDLIKALNLRLFDFPAGAVTDELFNRFREDVHAQLHDDDPIVVPAALLAMTDAQFVKLRARQDLHDPILRLCTAAGMNADASLFDALAARYGTSASQFAPFPDAPLFEAVERIVQAVNKGRRRKGIQPLWIYWCTEELFSDRKEVRADARRLWESRSSLVIVDSISALDVDVVRRLDRLPARRAGREARLWVPPYTHHTALLGNLFKAFTLGQFPLEDWHRHWEDGDPWHALAFDVGTSLTLSQWLFSALSDLIGPAEPVNDRIDEMQRKRDQPGRFAGGPNTFYSQEAGGGRR